MRRSRRMPARAPLVLAIAIFLAAWLVRSVTEDAARLKIDDVRLVSDYPATQGREARCGRAGSCRHGGRFRADRRPRSQHRAGDLRPARTRPGAIRSRRRPAMLARLDRAIELADESGLQRATTLFDHWSTYGDERGSELWASRFLRALPRRRAHRVHRAQERDRRRRSAGDGVGARAPARRSGAGSLYPCHALAGGRGNAATLRKLKQGLRGVDPDFWDIHVFARPDATYATLAAAKAVAAPLPLLIGETGYATIRTTRAIPASPTGARCRRPGRPTTSVRSPTRRRAWISRRRHRGRSTTSRRAPSPPRCGSQPSPFSTTTAC